MATVYLAEDLKLRRPVALKVLRPELAASLGKERFLREIEIGARLSHPNILALHDSGETSGYLYYAMPYVEGESLRQKLEREGQLPVAEVIEILRAVASALSHAHQHGIVHRDIKPENILLAKNSEGGAVHPLVADFGIARALDVAGGERLTETGLALGTPAYMSPEQAAGSRVDNRTDIYSLGCIAYEMLAGSPPFTGATAQAILARHAVNRPLPLQTVRPTVPMGVEEAIERALAKVPADRFATAEEFGRALSTDLSSRPSHRLNRTGPRRRVAVAAGFGLLALGGGALALRDSSSPAVVPSAASMAVLPFFAAGSDTALARLGRDLAVALGASLDGVGEIKTADRISIATATAGKHGLSTTEGAALARRLGATSFLRGTLTPAGDNVRLDLGLFDTKNIAPITKGLTVTAHRDSIGLLTDSASWSLLRQIWQRGKPPSPSLSAVTTKSIPALRAFLEGERMLASERWQEAALAYRSAIAADSAFWVAHFRYALAQYWMEQPVEPVVLKAIRQHRDMFPVQERMLAEAFLAWDTLDVKLERLEAVTRRFPNYWPGWFLYADHLHHNGPSMGHDWSEALNAFRQTVALNPNLAPAWSHIAWLALGKDPEVTSEAHSRLLGLGYPPPQLSDERFMFYLAEGVSRAGGVVPSDLHEVADSLVEFMVSPEGESMSRLLALKLLHVGFPAAQLELNNRALASGRASPHLVTWLKGVNAWAWASRGAWDSALTLMMDVVANHPGPYQPSGGKPVFALESYGLAVLGAWIGATSATTAQQRRATAEGVIATLPDGENRQDALGRLAWLDGLLAFVRGDRRAIQAARYAAAQSGYYQKALVDRLLDALDQGLAGNRKKAGEAVAEVEERCVLQAGCNYRTPHIAVQRLAAARWLHEAGDLERAARLLRYQDEPQRGWSWLFREALGGPTYLTRARIEESRGNDSLAQYYYTHFLERYDQPMPSQIHLVREARAALARLARQRDPPVAP